MMKKIGLIAGGGSLPVEFARAATENGEKVITFALEGIAAFELEKVSHKIYWIKIDQYAKFILLFIKERIRELTFLGKIYKNVVYEDIYMKELKGLPDKKDSTIFHEISGRLSKLGIKVVEGTRYLSHLLPDKGVLGKVAPDENISKDISFGLEAAKKIADMDIGQTVIVKDMNIVAVEAMEGTDAAIERAGQVAGTGCVMVKVSRTEQDMRWDIPTVGLKTIEKLAKNNFRALAIESGSMFLVDREKLLKIADENGIAVEAV